MEPSAVSKSQSESQQSFQFDGSGPGLKGVEASFPLFDNIYQFASIPNILCYLVLIFFFFQQIFVSFWIQGSLVWDTDITSSRMNSQFLKYYINIFLFQINDKDEKNILTTAIIYTVFMVLVVGFLEGQIIVYKIKRRFYKAVLIPTRILVELIPSILLIPISMLFGRSFFELLNQNFSGAIIISTVLTFIDLIFFIVLFSIYFSLSSYSPYLGISVVSAFSLKPLIHAGVLNCVVIAFGYILNYFYNWLMILLAIVHILGSAFILYLMTQRPFTQTDTNIIFTGMIISGVFLDIINLIMKAFKNINGDIMIYIVVAVLVISLVLSAVFFIVQAKMLHKNLTILRPENPNGQPSSKPINEDDYIPTDSDKIERFRQLKLDNNDYKALLYLFFVVSNRESINFDFSLVKYILQNNFSTDVLTHCMRIISLFPLESRLLNTLYADAIKRRDLRFYHKFFLFQINRIKILRQSSSSIQAADKLRELSNLSKDVFEEIAGFWDQTVANPGYLRRLRGMITKTRALWDESLQEYPNSSQHSDEYCHFLVDCATDFTGAVRQRHRAELIESGKNFSIDRCFRQFIGNFPEYLKKGTVDAKGMLLQTQKKRTGGSTNNSSSGNNKNKGSADSTNQSFSTMDAAMEESIAKALLSQARMRIALQNATEEKKARNSSRIKLALIICTLLMLASCSFVYFFYVDHYNERNSVGDRIELSNQVRLNLYSSAACLILQLAVGINVFDDSSIYGDIGDSDKDLWFTPYFNRSNTWDENAMIYNIKSRDYYTKFLDNIAQLSLNGENVYDLTGSLLEETLSISYCKDGVPLVPQVTNLQAMISYLFYTESMVSGNRNYPFWYPSNDEFCSLMKSLEYFHVAFTELKTDLSKSTANDFSETQKVLNMIIYTLPATLLVIVFISFLVSIVLFHKEIVFFMRLLVTLDPVVKHEASLPLKKDRTAAVEATKRAADASSAAGLTFQLVFMAAIGIIVVSVMILVQLMLIVGDYNKRFNYMTKWTISSHFCKSLSVELLLWSLEAVLITNSSVITNNRITDTSAIVKLLKADAEELQAAVNVITQDTVDLPSPSYFDEEINTLLHAEQCVMDANRSSLHELYRCSSVEHIITFYRDLINELIVKLYTYSGRFETDTPLNVLHISQAHVIPVLIRVDERFNLLYQTFLKNYRTNMTIFYVIEFVLSCALFVMMLLFAAYYDSCYNVILILLRRVSPISIVGKSELIEYLLDRESDKTSQVMTTARSVIHNSSDCIFCIGLSGVIESINPSVTNMLGYTPEQLLGQPMTMIFDDSEKQKIVSQVTLIKNRQCAPTFEDHTVAIMDDETQIPCAITILGMKNPNEENIKSFVYILRDEALLLKQQKEAEEAKKRSESLLYQILPRDIVYRLNQGEKDISFSVPSATIMFIDIVKFSEYASTLTPKEIMSNLSALFGKYDEALTNYNQLIKIKLIGDVYMCAGGLFTPEEPPQSHAEQMIKFGFDALQILEQTNIKLNAILSVRIGINTGGPLIAGVLGTDKPVFDIIGDPINIASRLQSTDVPGSIQISQDTYQLVSQNEAFNIEPRGEIFLKGKGKTPSFLVKPQKNNFSLNISSQETPTTSFVNLSIVPLGLKPDY